MLVLVLLMMMSSSLATTREKLMVKNARALSETNRGRELQCWALWKQFEYIITIKSLGMSLKKYIGSDVGNVVA